MWELNVGGGAGKWRVDGLYDGLTDVTRRIVSLEEDPTAGIFYSLHVLGNLAATDTDILSELEYTGRKALYAVRRRVH